MGVYATEGGGIHVEREDAWRKLVPNRLVPENARGNAADSTAIVVTNEDQTIIGKVAIYVVHRHNDR